MTDGQTILFREEQRFRQPLLWLGLLAGCLAALGLLGLALWQQLGRGRPLPGANPLSDAMLIAVTALVTVVMAGVLALFWSARLETEVRPDGLHARFFPFHRRFRHFPLGEITRWEAVRYHPLIEYGGFGIRWGLRGTAWNVSGDRGVRLEFDSRRRLLIGSRRPEELVEALEEARRKVRPGRW
jgi:hypothetical protein